MLFSLVTLYGIDISQRPEYRERADELMREIQQSFFSGMEDCHDDLMKRLQIVESLECLGIDRHFQHEIQIALDFVYRYIT